MPVMCRPAPCDNNLYAQFYPSERTGVIAGVDVNLQRYPHLFVKYGLAPVVIVRQMISRKWFAAARAEYYRDYYALILPARLPGGLMIFGGSLGLDYMPVPNACWRIEGRWLRPSDDFSAGFKSPHNFCVTTSIAFSL
jgi:hypothetical protein